MTDPSLEARASTASRLRNYSQHEIFVAELRGNASTPDAKRHRVLSALSAKGPNPESRWAATGTIERRPKMWCICSAEIGPDGQELTWWSRLKGWFCRCRRPPCAFYIRNKDTGKHLWVGRQCLLKIGTDQDKREARALIDQLQGEICPVCWQLGHTCPGPRLKDPLYLNGRVCVVCHRRAIRPESDEIACIPCLSKLRPKTPT